MSYTFLQESGEESLAESFLDIPASMLLKLNHSAAKSFSKDSAMEFFQNSQSGMMCEHLMEDLGMGKLMPSAEDFHAKTSVVREKGLELKGQKADSGQTWCESLAKLSQDMSSWKIHPYLLPGVLDEFCGTWPEWGMMRDGVSFVGTTLVVRTLGNAFSCLPTIRRSGQSRAHTCFIRKNYQGNLEEFLGMNGYKGKINPSFYEQMMSLPIGWTDVSPLATGKFQQWLRLHGKL